MYIVLIFRIVVLASLMFLDYYLTLRSYFWYQKAGKKHTKVETFELNPMFQTDVSQMRYNKRHLISVLISCCVLIYLAVGSEVFDISWLNTLYDVVFGLHLCTFTYINTKHIQGIMITKLIMREPKLISGRQSYSYIFSLRASSIQAFSLSILLFIIFIITPKPVIFGFFLGPLYIIYTHWRWEKRSKKTAPPKSAKPKH